MPGRAGLANSGPQVLGNYGRLREGVAWADPALGRKGGWEPGRIPYPSPGPRGCLQCSEGPRTQGWGHSTEVISTAGRMAGSAARCPGLNPAYPS